MAPGRRALAAEVETHIREKDRVRLRAHAEARPGIRWTMAQRTTRTRRVEYDIPPS